MILFFGFKAIRLLLFLLWFLLPLKIAFHNNNTSIFNDVHKCLFTCELLDSSINNHIKVCLSSPFHERHLSIGMLFWFFIIFFIFTFNFLLFFHFFFSIFFFFFILINWTIFNDRNICCWAYVVRSSVHLRIRNFRSSCNLHKSCKG